MRRGTAPSLDKIMACLRFGPNPLYERMRAYHQLDHKENTSMKFICTSHFIQENVIGNSVCKLTAICSRPQRVNLDVVVLLTTVYHYVFDASG